MLVESFFGGAATRDTTSLVLAGGSDTYPKDMCPHNMTNSTTPSPYVASASSEFTGGGRVAWCAFDGAFGLGNDWLGTGGGVDWLRLDFGSGNGFAAIQYSVTVNTWPEPARAPKNWTFEGSNNGSSWTVLDTQTNQTAWTSGQKRTFSFSNSTSYRYYRVNITANNGDATYTQIAELYISGPLFVSRGGAGVIGRMRLWGAVTDAAPSPPNWGAVAGLPEGVTTIPYDWEFDMPLSASPVAYAVTSGALPAGISLTALGSTGLKLSGTPTVPGTSTFTITATNVYGSAAKAFTLVVAAMSGGGGGGRGGNSAWVSY